MKKILIVTLQGDNIGNRLQNYALQKVIMNLNFEVYTPVYRTTEFDTVKKRIKLFIKAILGKMGFSRYRNDYFRIKRKLKYRKYNRKYISNMFKMTYEKSFNSDWSKYDYAITGSDQVWHGWTKNQYELPYFYLEFINAEKRLCYAPSFGFEEFPKENVQAHLKGLSGIKNISIREKSSVELIKKMTGLDAKWVLDPTLLIDKTEWKSIETVSPLYNGKKYILIYFLGNKEDEYLKAIRTFADKNKLEVIDALERNSLLSMLTTPDEFIWLVEHASFVCTDSFHGTVFSIIFDKKFLVFRRKEHNMENMFNRIETILDIFELDTRIYKGNMELIFAEYQKKNIDEIKKESLSFLHSILKVDNSNQNELLNCEYGK